MKTLLHSGLVATACLLSALGGLSAAPLSVIVGSEDLVTDTTGTSTANITAANAGSLSALILAAGSAGGTDPYAAVRYNPQYKGQGDGGSFTSNGVTVEFASSGTSDSASTLDFTFTYPAFTQDIYSATFYIDLSDDDGNTLSFVTDSGQSLGPTATLNDSGNPSTFWAAIDAQANGNVDSALAIVLDAAEIADLQDGSYTLSGTWDASASPNGLFASNRAKLVIEFDPPASVDAFTIDDFYAQPGQSVTLSWTTSAADSVQIEPGIGDVTGLTLDGAGSTSVIVSTDTTFTLTASNAESEASAEVTIQVGADRPNVVLFLVDDMGPMDTSVPFVFDGNGDPVTYQFNQLYVTPNMESLAANGMRFTDFYAQPTCSPTRSSLMTGLNTTGHAVTSWIKSTGARQGQYAPLNYRNRGFEDEDEPTLPKWLGAAGYRTIHCGKGHFTDQHDSSEYEWVEDPRFIGFDINIGGSWMGQPGSYFGAADYASGGRPSWLIPGLEDFHGTDVFLTDALTRKASEAITESIDRGQPFFLYMSHYAVHAPFQPDPRATGNYDALSGDNQDFATMIEGMDLSLGDLINYLKDPNGDEDQSDSIAENTLILFMGDNGSDNRLLNDNALPDSPYHDYPLRGMKGNRSEGGIRTPFIAAWAQPDASNAFQQQLSIPANTVEHTIAACWDIPMTIMSVAGVNVPEGVHTHGTDLSPYLRGEQGEHRAQEVLIYYPHGRDGNDHFANFRRDNWKLIYLWEEDRFALYDLATDPTESTDLSSTNPDKLLELARGMAQQFDEEWGGRFGTIWPQDTTNAAGVLSIIDTMEASLDLDNDGLPDLNEDLDGNGLVGDGETDPDSSDTDNDRTDDYTEIRLGLDPLDANSSFVLQASAANANSLNLTWPSAPGLSFNILSSDDLSTPTENWDVLFPGVSADDTLPETVQTVPVDTGTQFFSVELLPE
ncbi:MULTISPECIES: sulfatase-like hydrolase/transferase [unclassified Lentimonas]|uniref:sulfatase-like hydrolase/transferase n=1 Tax=unclassified Lentimonas TaxID=2630993 RepID=UPI001329E249|nr:MULTISPECIES: sulfatase-like hydrolase/transferase [unclassified Lentimonas]CAA6677614.1 N-acetylgalactosamine-6-sulfatase [Lentimonas sp. CC4]CAA6684288.1 N-acetylgalactosamine-6-sulfatase [Lentimonas sp. CC6]CAA7078196.1 N-acetylgalactosamine-6-sulfatase [Lentimonas sp. CC4]CAA7168288.1 N-acetylgalactosamine-6-sulfatase [Lentimonas sp. CC21]CAA7181878.1 N-acetylgalactosamine-6-sulfatase [Lentimonas sp. CC8]